MSSTDRTASLARMLVGLIDKSHLLAPDQLPGIVRRYGSEAGLGDVWIYLTDLQQDVLVPLPVDGHVPGGPMSIDGSIAGRAFWSEQVLDAAASPPSQGRWLWVPVVDGSERLGVLRLTVDRVTDDLLTLAGPLAGLVALMLVSKRPFDDASAKLTRLRPATLAAEMQWGLLPPLTVATPDVVVSAVTEPAYEIGGDAFDYAMDGSVLHLAIFDAMGHDLRAGLAATLAVGAWRYARRIGQDLAQASMTIDAAIEEHFQRDRYVTAVLAALDTATGRLRWVNRGHLEPLLVRPGAPLQVLSAPVMPLMGLGLAASPTAHTTQLQPGDRLLLYTDGIVEAHNPGQEVFGRGAFADFIVRHHADGLSAPETLRRLIHAIVQHHHETLADDASVVLAHWNPARPKAQADAPR